MCQKHSIEWREAVRKRNTGRQLSAITRERIGNALRNPTEETRQKMRAGRTVEVRKRVSQCLKGRRPSIETRERLSKAKKGRRLSVETRKRIGENNVGMRGQYHSFETRQKMREAARALWQNPDWARKTSLARGCRPNRAELRLGAIIGSLGFGYVGDGQLIIGGKCPDFWNGYHKLVELYGDYWHRGDDPQERVTWLRRYGYDCVVVWEHELADPEEIKRRVQVFCEQGGR